MSTSISVAIGNLSFWERRFSKMVELAKLLYQDYLGAMHLSGRKIQYAVT